MGAVRRHFLRSLLQISPCPPASEGRIGCRLTPFSPQPPSNLSSPASGRGENWVSFAAIFSAASFKSLLSRQRARGEVSAVRHRLLRSLLQISPCPPASEGRVGCRSTPPSPQAPSNLPSPAGGRGVGGEGNRRQKKSPLACENAQHGRKATCYPPYAFGARRCAFAPYHRDNIVPDQ